MQKCMRCGEYLKPHDSKNTVLCIECADYEFERGITRCRSCGKIFEPDELIKGLCNSCINSDDSDEYENDIEFVSFEDEFNDELDEDYEDYE